MGGHGLEDGGEDREKYLRSKASEIGVKTMKVEDVESSLGKFPSNEE